MYNHKYYINTMILLQSLNNGVCACPHIGIRVLGGRKQWRNKGIEEN